MRRVLWIRVLLTGLFVAALLFVDTVPPRSVTHTNMHMMKRRILRFASAHSALPTSVEQLPRIEGFANEVTDGWGRLIRFRVEGNDVTLTSYGRDGKPGGDGEDADMVAVFRVKTDIGAWAGEFSDWRNDPVGRGK
jgi:hypothetical protein